MDAEVFRAWIANAAQAIQANRDRLTQLDAAIGDADHCAMRHAPRPDSCFRTKD